MVYDFYSSWDCQETIENSTQFPNSIIAISDAAKRSHDANLIQNVLLIFIHPHFNTFTEISQVSSIFLYKNGAWQMWPRKFKAQSSNYGLSVAVQQTHISKRHSVLVYLYRMKIFAERIKLSDLVRNGLVSEFWLLNYLL